MFDVFEALGKSDPNNPQHFQTAQELSLKARDYQKVIDFMDSVVNEKHPENDSEPFNFQILKIVNQ